MQKNDDKKCPHHWQIDPAGRGVCQLCGAVKQFPVELHQNAIFPKVWHTDLVGESKNPRSGSASKLHA